MFCAVAMPVLAVTGFAGSNLRPTSATASVTRCRDGFGGRHVGVGKDDEELVAAVAPDEIALARRPSHRLGDLHEEQIAAEVSLRVVDALEVVEVEHHDAELPAAVEQALERVEREAPVRETGERIALAELLEPRVGRREIPLASIERAHERADDRDARAERDDDDERRDDARVQRRPPERGELGNVGRVRETPGPFEPDDGVERERVRAGEEERDAPPDDQRVEHGREHVERRHRAARGAEAVDEVRHDGAVAEPRRSRAQRPPTS